MISYSTISSNWRYIINRKQTTTLRIIFDETYGNKDSFAKSRASIDDRTRVCVYVCVCDRKRKRKEKYKRRGEAQVQVQRMYSAHMYMCNCCFVTNTLLNAFCLTLVSFTRSNRQPSSEGWQSNLAAKYGFFVFTERERTFTRTPKQYLLTYLTAYSKYVCVYIEKRTRAIYW